MFCGWFPLYPFLTYAIGKILPLGFTKLGCIVSFCCFIASVHVFYHILGLDSTLNKELAVLLYLLNIGNIYFIAVFPMSLCMLFWNLSILSILKKKYVISGICCFFASMSYSTAFLLCGILGLYIIQEWIKEKQKVPVLIGRILKSPFIGFLGFIFVQIIIYIFTGNYKAFFLTQKKYGHGIHNPIKTLLGFILPIVSPDSPDRWQGFISLVFLSLFILMTYLFIKEKLYQNNLSAISYLCILIIYIFLLIMGTAVTPYRQYLLCGNAMIILSSNSINKYLKTLIIIILVICTVTVTKLFLDSVIV